MTASMFFQRPPILTYGAAELKRVANKNAATAFAFTIFGFTAVSLLALALLQGSTVATLPGVVDASLGKDIELINIEKPALPPSTVHALNGGQSGEIDRSSVKKPMPPQQPDVGAFVPTQKWDEIDTVEFRPDADIGNFDIQGDSTYNEYENDPCIDCDTTIVPPDGQFKDEVFTPWRVDTAPEIDLNQLRNRIEYPQLEIERGREGAVLVRVLVSEDGLPEDYVIEQSINERFDAAAVKAIMNSTFTPAQRQGQNVPCWISIPVEFRLR